MNNKYISPEKNPLAFLDHLEKRGLVHDQTPEIKNYFAACMKSAEIPKIYCGFDPSAASIQVGNLLPLLMLRRAQLFGIQPIVLVGGATGLIGDPSGKKEERNLLDQSIAHSNLEKMQKQLLHFLDHSEPSTKPILVNNYEWFQNFNFLNFLRDVGKHISINYMIAKESVKIRMETGISYAEFGYMLVQGYDFLHLYEKLGCRVQIGGSDQWGNMTTGMELIRRKHQAEVHALSAPLLLDSAGNKFGKSEKGTLFLDASLTSPFQLYQFFLQTPDADVCKILRALTLFSDEYIDTLEEHMKREPEARIPQKELGLELCTMAHGMNASRGVEAASRVLFSKDPKALESLDDSALQVLSAEVPSSNFSQTIGILDLLVQSGLCKSKGEARRHLSGGAIHINRGKITDETLQISSETFAGKKFLLLGLGKSSLHLVLRK